jgi:hypothetical protein
MTNSGVVTRKHILGNAFSIQMLEGSSTLRFERIEASDIPKDCVSAIGHPDTAAVLTDVLGFDVPMNRCMVTIDNDTELYVAQLSKGRLPEGSTTLPEGFEFKFWKVFLED